MADRQVLSGAVPTSLEETIAGCRRVGEENPECAELQVDLGVRLDRAGDREGAVACYRRALALDPASHAAYNNLGTIFASLGDTQTALIFLEAAAMLDPHAADTQNNLGNLYLKCDRTDAAIERYLKAIALRPEVAAYYNHLGKALIAAERYWEAKTVLWHALTLRPDYPEVYLNLGFLSLEQLEIEQAERHYREAIALDPELAMAHTLLGQMLLLQGRLAEGWEAQEWRWRWKDFPSPVRSFTQPQWRGEAVAGARIFLHAEQGFGDTLQMLRYVPLVARLGGVVTLEVHPELKRLAATLDGVSGVLARGETLPEFDSHCPLMSLPLVFATTLATIPATIPYLHPQAEWVAPIFAESGRRLKVGLVWAGNPKNRRDGKRSLPLSALAPLFAVERVSFYCLQRGAASDDPELKGFPFAGFLGPAGDFADTAAVLCSLDLIVTADTAVAHLAGALGKTVWVVLPRVPSWRWLLDREDSPWYPTARLFRQRVAGDWAPVIQSVAAALASLASVAGGDSAARF